MKYKIRYIDPKELMNLNDEAREYFLNLKSDDIIGYEEFEDLLEMINMIDGTIDKKNLIELIELNGINVNYKIN